MFITLIENKTNARWCIPKGIHFGEGQMLVAPNSQVEFRNADEAAIYARYSRITLITKLNDEGERIYLVKTERHRDWKPPKKRGWTLLIINETGNPLYLHAYRSGELCVQSLAGVELELFNIDPREYLSQFKRLERTQDSIKRYPDPRARGGYREVLESGVFRPIPREEQELVEIEQERRRLASHYAMPVLQELERRKILDAKDSKKIFDAKEVY